MKHNNAAKLLAKDKGVKAMLTRVKDEIGKMVVNHFKKSFDREGFNNVPFMHWKLLKNRERRKWPSRKILVQTGTLKRGLNYRARVTLNRYSIEVFNNVEYAAVHNEGLRAGRGAGFKMPKRQFMGYSKPLIKRIETRINNRIVQTFR